MTSRVCLKTNRRSVKLPRSPGRRQPCPTHTPISTATTSTMRPPGTASRIVGRPESLDRVSPTSDRRQRLPMESDPAVTPSRSRHQSPRCPPVPPPTAAARGRAPAHRRSTACGQAKNAMRSRPTRATGGPGIGCCPDAGQQRANRRSRRGLREDLAVRGGDHRARRLMVPGLAVREGEFAGWCFGDDVAACWIELMRNVALGHLLWGVRGRNLDKCKSLRRALSSSVKTSPRL
jgi:hypothetical protein